MLHINLFAHGVYFKIHILLDLSNFDDFLIEGPLIGMGYGKILLGFFHNTKDGEQLYSMLLIIEVRQVMGI